jgi:hypothetical protein
MSDAFAGLTYIRVQGTRFWGCQAYLTANAANCGSRPTASDAWDDWDRGGAGPHAASKINAVRAASKAGLTRHRLRGTLGFPSRICARRWRMIHRGKVSATAYDSANVIRHHLSPGNRCGSNSRAKSCKSFCDRRDAAAGADLAYLRGSCRVRIGRYSLPGNCFLPDFRRYNNEYRLKKHGSALRLTAKWG